MKHLTLTLTLAGLAMIGPFAIDTYLPAFHDIARDYGVSELMVQQTLSVYLLAVALMTLVLGPVSDALGRRPVILAGLAVFGVASIGAALAPSFGWLLAFRALQGVSAGAGMVVGQAVVRDRLAGAEAHRMMANIMMVFGLAPAIAPIIGGYLTHLGWRSIFVLLALIAAALWALCWRSLPESLAPPLRQPLHLASMLNNYARVLRHRQFLLGALAPGLGFAGFAIYISAAANYVIEVLGLSATSFGWLFVPMIGGTILGSAASGRLTHHFSTLAIVRGGAFVMLGGAVFNLAYALIFPAQVPWAVLPILVYSFGLALARPGMTVVTLSLFPRMSGLAAALQNFLQTLIFALISGFVVPLLFGSAAKLAAGVVVGVALSVACWVLAGFGSGPLRAHDEFAGRGRGGD